MTTPTFLVGAYASMPERCEEKEGYYRLLGNQSWIDSAEIPFPGDLMQAGKREWLALNLPKRWQKNVITAIPGTMQSVGKNARFGLASSDASGREAAIELMKELRNALIEFANLRGSQDISTIEIQSAPTGTANKSAFERSVSELTSWDWLGASLVIEHCDRFIKGQLPEKGFLSLEEEIDVARRTGTGISINWGRSTIEGRDAMLPQSHLTQTVEAGILRGLVFSGAGPAATQYGYEWVDGHLPMNPDEPTSLMTSDHIRECSNIARQSKGTQYLGAKVCATNDLSLEGRIDFLQHIYTYTREEVNEEGQQHAVLKTVV